MVIRCIKWQAAHKVLEPENIAHGDAPGLRSRQSLCGVRGGGNLPAQSGAALHEWLPRSTGQNFLQKKLWCTSKSNNLGISQPYLWSRSFERHGALQHCIRKTKWLLIHRRDNVLLGDIKSREITWCLLPGTVLSGKGIRHLFPYFGRKI